ncbi:Predicted exporter protein, RND superfamily [Halogranum amylolyticum]|uniref:Predicted exporter protein, RND superfamily n=1 Tax=Halogranum amylolyticum TaxID=660520 RepID=A0A1H8W4W4_9EURY|nr:MMPL family transporter [Halogranum amylolyticum]SEP22681.1 Predicted exporter protein, RND superfamily [Halogranum amylolyticum]
MRPRLQRLVDRGDAWIVDRPGRVVLAFLLVTAVFGVGLANVSTETGTESFSEDLPEQRALDAVTDRFEDPFDPDPQTTQLIQSGENVVSKPGLVRMAEAQYRLAERPDLRVVSTRSAASTVATRLDPAATTLEAQRDVLRRAPPDAVRQAVRETAAENPAFVRLLSRDFNRRSATASATVAVVEHDVPGDPAEQGETGELTRIQRTSQRVVATVGGDIRVFGAGIINDEFSTVIGDSLLVVIPAAVVLLVGFLLLAYRDLVDLLLGMVALGTTIVWTLGFMGLVGIPFSQILIAVPPLLLAVGIDFGIHAINRFREEKTTGADRETAMRRTTDQLLVAFFLVTATSVVGFAANLVSGLPPIREFGVVASVGIVFAFLVFGVFLPALKMYTDDLRERYPGVPTFSQAPLASAESTVGGVLRVGVVVGRRAPLAVVAVALVTAAGAGVYATGVDTTFTQEQFLPPEETPAYLASLPEPFRPSEYTITRDINFLEDSFEASEGDQVVVYVEGPMTRDGALESMARAGDDPPSTFVRDGRRAEEESIVTLVRFHAARDPAFAALVERNDADRNGIPDENLDRVYDALFASPVGDAAETYLTDDRRSARVLYTVQGDAVDAEITADARAVADKYRYRATATGEIVVFQAIADLIFESAILSLALALVGTGVFLVVAFAALEGRPSLGLVNLLPIVLTVTFVAATMRLVGYSLNAFTATVLAMTIGLGIDYSVHVVHRFVDELDAGSDPVTAATATVVGTGGALAGSMLTTVFGIGVLVLAVFPAIGQFGVLAATSVVYSFFSSMLVLPAALLLWSRFVGRETTAAGQVTTES